MVCLQKAWRSNGIADLQMGVELNWASMLAMEVSFFFNLSEPVMRLFFQLGWMLHKCLALLISVYLEINFRV